MSTIQQSKEWQSPAFLLKLLQQQSKSLQDYVQGLNNGEFDEMCRTDHALRKNLILDIRDMRFSVQQLEYILSQ